MPDLFDEIKDDIKQEQYAKLWQDVGNYVIGAAVGVVLITAGAVGWSSYKKSELESRGNDLYHAYVDESNGEADSSLKKYSELESKNENGFSAMARLRKASVLLKEGKPDEAVKIYNQLSKDKKSPVEVREFAEILYLYNSGVNDEEFLSRIKSVAGSEGAFQHSAKELLAFSEINLGNVEGARGIFEWLISDNLTPMKMKERSSEMVGAIKSNVMENNG